MITVAYLFAGVAWGVFATLIVQRILKPKLCHQCHGKGGFWSQAYAHQTSTFIPCPYCKTEDKR